MKPLFVVLQLQVCALSCAWADDCSYVRLDQPGGSAYELPVYDQGTANRCYAYAASETFDTFRVGVLGQAMGVPTSPTETALFYKARYHPEEETLDATSHSGGPLNALTDLSAEGGCSLSPGFDGLVSRIFDSSNESAYESAYGCPCEFQPHYPGLIRAEAIAAKNDCRGRTHFVSGVRAQNLYFASPMRTAADILQLRSTLDRILVNDRSQAPTIMYAKDLLTAQNPAATGEVMSQHASVIVGRRRGPGGRCQYLVRNSWGPRCDAYGYVWECENGQLWIDAEALLRFTREIDYLSRF